MPTSALRPEPRPYEPTSNNRTHNPAFVVVHFLDHALQLRIVNIQVRACTRSRPLSHSRPRSFPIVELTLLTSLDHRIHDGVARTFVGPEERSVIEFTGVVQLPIDGSQVEES